MGEAANLGAILTDADANFLRQAIGVAAAARAHGNHPFGSIIVDSGGSVLVESENEVNSRRDSTAHAEMLAASVASRTIPYESLLASTLYTSTEPCAMCAGAIYWAGIGRVVYGLSEADLLDITGASSENPTMHLGCRVVLSAGQRATVVVGPGLPVEAAVVHDGFWR